MQRGPLLSATAGLCVAAGAALAQPVASLDTTLPRVIVTGSQVPRVDAETALPVQIIRREEIERSGAANAEELLRRISANFAGVNVAMGVGDLASPGFSGASLRGFG